MFGSVGRIFGMHSATGIVKRGGFTHVERKATADPPEKLKLRLDFEL